MRKAHVAISLAVVILGVAAWQLRAEPQPPASPSIPAPSITPNLITVGTPTQVTFTVSIPEPTLNPASVNLLRLGANGSSTIVAQMVDNGQNGDQTPGDKVFTARVVLNEAQPRAFGFQVSAAFRGVLRRSVSPTQQFAALAPATVPVVLPPDPGEGGKTTVAGIDSDGNGVRDDVQRYIIFSYPGSERTRAALFQSSRASQNFILIGGRANAEVMFQADRCLETIVGIVQADSASKALEAESLNTRARTTAFLAADKAIAGSFAFGAMDNRPSFCQFDPSGMMN